MGYITGIRYSNDKSNIEYYRYEYTDKNGKNQIATVSLDQMIEAVKSGKYNNVQTKNGAKVVARLTTVANGKQTDNLQSLPEF